MKLKAMRNLFGRPCGGYHLGNDNEKLFFGGPNGEEIPLTADELAKVEIEYKKLQKEYDDLEYSRRRAREYDALNQFELMTDDAANSTTTHADAIAVVKAKWPKDNSGPVE